MYKLICLKRHFVCCCPAVPRRCSCAQILCAGADAGLAAARPPHVAPPRIGCGATPTQASFCHPSHRPPRRRPSQISCRDRARRLPAMALSGRKRCSRIICHHSSTRHLPRLVAKRSASAAPTASPRRCCCCWLRSYPMTSGCHWTCETGSRQTHCPARGHASCAAASLAWAAVSIRHRCPPHPTPLSPAAPARSPAQVRGRQHRSCPPAMSVSWSRSQPAAAAAAAAVAPAAAAAAAAPSRHRCRSYGHYSRAHCACSHAG